MLSINKTDLALVHANRMAVAKRFNISEGQPVLSGVGKVTSSPLPTFLPYFPYFPPSILLLFPSLFSRSIHAKRFLFLLAVFLFTVFTCYFVTVWGWQRVYVFRNGSLHMIGSFKLFLQMGLDIDMYRYIPEVDLKKMHYGARLSG